MAILNARCILAITYMLITQLITTAAQCNCPGRNLRSGALKDINVTYVHVNQKPYEFIHNSEWTFRFGTGNGNKTLEGVISRTLNYITKKHCKHYHFKPKLVPNFSTMMKYLKMNSIKDLNENGIEGEHFIFAPLPMSADIYYTLHYHPELFTWQEGFAKSDGLVVVRRIEDVDITRRIIRAVAKSKLLFGFMGILTFLVGTLMWLLDRSWSEYDRNFIARIFRKVYWAFVTMTTVGYGDEVPEKAVGRVLGVIWMMISLIIVSCITSLITSGMMDNSVNVRNQTLGVVHNTWDDFIGRLLVNRKRSRNSILNYTTYDALFDAVRNDKRVFAGLVDKNVASALIDEIDARDLGKDFIP